MKIYRIRSFEEFEEYIESNKLLLDKHELYLDSIIPDKEEDFTVSGYSYTANKHVDFLVDFQHSGGAGKVNWRERVCCPETYYNNRMRALIHLFDIEIGAYRNSKIYLTEQITPIYKYFAENYDSVVGSEFLGHDITPGKMDKNGIRNEDLCSLSFADNTFEFMISLDVLEHVPEYELAFRECARVIEPNGKLMWSVPFIKESRQNSIRAKVVDGKIEHLLSPEYHGDPLSSKGVLCYQHFGWEMLEQMKASGFSDAYAICYQSIEYGYLGGTQLMFVAVK